MRDPRLDPQPGDELKGDCRLYRVLSVTNKSVQYEVMVGTLFAGESSSTLTGWRYLAELLTVERVA